MKIIRIFFLLVSFFFSATIFSQNYKFNKLIIYKGTILNSNNYAYCNSLNENQFLEFRNDIFGLYAELVDLETQLCHRFKVDTTKTSENNIVLKFTYEYSKKNHFFDFGNNYYEYEIIKEDDKSSMGFIKIFKNKKKKKLLYKIEIEVLKKDTNYFNVFRFLFMHPYERNKKLDIKINGIIKKSSFFNGESDINLELTSFEDTNLDILVPKKLVMKQI